MRSKRRGVKFWEWGRGGGWGGGRSLHETPQLNFFLGIPGSHVMSQQSCS